VLHFLGESDENLWLAWILSVQRATYESYYRRRKIRTSAQLKESAEKLSRAARALANEMTRIYDEHLLLPLLDRQYQAYWEAYEDRPVRQSPAARGSETALPVRATSSKAKKAHPRHQMDWAASIDEVTFLALAAHHISDRIKTRPGRQTNVYHNLTVVCLIADAWVCAGKGRPSAAEESKFARFVGNIGPAFGPFPNNVKDALKYWRSVRRQDAYGAEQYGYPPFLDAIDLGKHTVGQIALPSETLLYHRAKKLGTWFMPAR